jgi:capsular polysaccharide transport system ATP-binding protein
MLGRIEFPQKGKIESAQTFSWPLAQTAGFVGNMSGRNNVKFVCRLYSKSDQETKEIIEFVQDFSELGDYFEMPIKTYSTGMRGRLNFGLSLAFDFDYLLIDETLSTGDANFRQKAKDMLMKKIERSQILLVSHSMPTLKEMCHMGLLVHEGNLHYFDHIDDAVEMYEEINKKARKK